MLRKFERYHPKRDNLQVPSFWNTESSGKRIGLRSLQANHR